VATERVELRVIATKDAWRDFHEIVFAPCDIITGYFTPEKARFVGLSPDKTKAYEIEIDKAFFHAYDVVKETPVFEFGEFGFRKALRRKEKEFELVLKENRLILRPLGVEEGEEVGELSEWKREEIDKLSPQNLMVGDLNEVAVHGPHLKWLSEFLDFSRHGLDILRLDWRKPPYEKPELFMTIHDSELTRILVFPFYEMRMFYEEGCTSYTVDFRIPVVHAWIAYIEGRKDRPLRITVRGNHYDFVLAKAQRAEEEEGGYKRVSLPELEGYYENPDPKALTYLIALTETHALDNALTYSTLRGYSGFELKGLNSAHTLYISAFVFCEGKRIEDKVLRLEPTGGVTFLEKAIEWISAFAMRDRKLGYRGRELWLVSDAGALKLGSVLEPSEAREFEKGVEKVASEAKNIREWATGEGLWEWDFARKSGRWTVAGSYPTLFGKPCAFAGTLADKIAKAVEPYRRYIHYLKLYFTPAPDLLMEVDETKWTLHDFDLVFGPHFAATAVIASDFPVAYRLKDLKNCPLAIIFRAFLPACVWYTLFGGNLIVVGLLAQNDGQMLSWLQRLNVIRPPTEADVLDALKERPGATLTEINDILISKGISTVDVEKLLAQLSAKRSILVKEGRYYVVGEKLARPEEIEAKRYELGTEVKEKLIPEAEKLSREIRDYMESFKKEVVAKSSELKAEYEALPSIWTAEERDEALRKIDAFLKKVKPWFEDLEKRRVIDEAKKKLAEYKERFDALKRKEGELVAKATGMGLDYSLIPNFADFGATLARIEKAIFDFTDILDDLEEWGKKIEELERTLRIWGPPPPPPAPPPPPKVPGVPPEIEKRFAEIEEMIKRAEERLKKFYEERGPIDEEERRLVSQATDLIHLYWGKKKAPEEFVREGEPLLKAMKETLSRAKEYNRKYEEHFVMHKEDLERIGRAFEDLDKAIEAEVWDLVRERYYNLKDRFESLRIRPLRIDTRGLEHWITELEVALSDAKKALEKAPPGIEELKKETKALEPELDSFDKATQEAYNLADGIARTVGLLEGAGDKALIAFTEGKYHEASRLIEEGIKELEGRLPELESKAREVEGRLKELSRKASELERRLKELREKASRLGIKSEDADAIVGPLESKLIVAKSRVEKAPKIDIAPLQGKLARLKDVLGEAKEKAKVVAPREPAEKPREVETWERQLRVNIIGWRQETPPGFRYPVWVLWVKDEETGEVVKVVMGYPYTEHHKYRLVRTTNKAGYKVNFMAFAEEAPKVAPRLPPHPEVSRSLEMAARSVETAMRAIPEEVRRATEEVVKALAARPFDWRELKADVSKLYEKISAWERCVEERNDVGLYSYLVAFKDRMRAWLERVARAIPELHAKFEEAKVKAPPPRLPREDVERLWKLWEETLRKHGIDPHKYKEEYFDVDVGIAERYEDALLMIQDDLKWIIAQEQQRRAHFDVEKPEVKVERFSWKRIGQGVGYIKVRLMYLLDAIEKRNLYAAYEAIRDIIDASYRLLEILRLSPNVKKFRDLTGLE
jgi:hypothetical protein